MKYTKNSSNNFMCPHDVLEDIKFKKMPASAQMFYIHLCKLANRYDEGNGWFFRSLENLMNDTQKSRSVIIRSKKSLLKNHFINVKRGYYKNTKIRTYDYYKLNGFRFKK